MVFRWLPNKEENLLGINTISQLSPLIVLFIGFYFRATWDKGLRVLFFLYLLAGLFEIIHELVGGLPIMYHLWTPIEVGFLLYIYSRWSDFNYKIIFVIYLVVWSMLRIVGLESFQGLNMDTLSLIFASLIFIFIPMCIFDVKPYQKFFMYVMSIYYGGALVFFITINTLQNKVLAWELHSVFNIIAAIGSATVFFIRNNEIIYSTRPLISSSLPPIRKI